MRTLNGNVRPPLQRTGQLHLRVLTYCVVLRVQERFCEHPESKISEVLILSVERAVSETMYWHPYFGAQPVYIGASVSKTAARMIQPEIFL
jgi:hypothetical protein